VELTVARGGKERLVVVVPLPDETPLRYQDWVVRRRREVHERTGGRVGYVHIPDMMSAGWAEFHRDLRAELERDALVVDTRENGGGHVSQLVLERLSRRRIGGDVVRHGPDEPWPGQAPKGPLVSLANEYAGSDGDIVNESFKEMRLGPVVGTRTWGGVIGIDGRYSLVDGTSVTQPRYAFWFREAGWGVENYGVDPDVEVPMPPQAWASGQDPQLEEGLRIVLAAVEEWPELVQPPIETRPDRSAPALPPRPSGR
jgi:tricorn protease